LSNGRSLNVNGADSTADFFYYLEMAALFAALSLGSAWTLFTFAVCVPVGGVLRAVTSLRWALLLGLVLVALTITVDTIAVALELSDDPDFVTPVWPEYFLSLVLSLSWLFRLLIGCVMLGAGIWLTDRTARDRAARLQPLPNRAAGSDGRSGNEKRPPSGGEKRSQPSPGRRRRSRRR
jgi:hypothetical protein